MPLKSFIKLNALVNNPNIVPIINNATPNIINPNPTNELLSSILVPISFVLFVDMINQHHIQNTHKNSQVFHFYNKDTSYYNFAFNCLIILITIYIPNPQNIKVNNNAGKATLISDVLIIV